MKCATLKFGTWAWQRAVNEQISTCEYVHNALGQVKTSRQGVECQK